MRSAGIVVWRKIVEVLHDDIASGAIPAGSRLPTETILAQRFGVNRHTLRRALAELQADGLVSVQHGRGSFVRLQPVVDYPLAARTRFSDIVSAQSRLPEGELLDTREELASADVAKALELPAGARLVTLDILRRVDGLPISVSTTCLDATRFTGIDAAFTDTRSLTLALERFGIVDYMRRRTRIWTRMPTAEEALLLRQTNDKPVLVMESIDQDLSGHALQFSVARAAGDRLQLVVGS